MMEIIDRLESALEILSSVSGGCRLQPAGRSACPAGIDMRKEAKELISRYSELPLIQQLVIRAKLVKGMPDQLDESCRAIVAALEDDFDRDGKPRWLHLFRFGQDGLCYWIRHWACGEGSSRQASELFGMSQGSHHRFWKEVVEFQLNSFVASAADKLVVDECAAGS